MSTANDMVVGHTLGQQSVGAVNLSLVKVTTITQTLLGVAVTSLVVVATVVTVALIATRTGLVAPIANPDYAVNYKTVQFEIYPLLNDVNPRGDNLSIVSITSPLHGTAEIADANRIIYKSFMYWAGVEHINYTCMNDKLTAEAPITISILNHPPEPIEQSYIVSKNSRNNQLDIFGYKNDAGQQVFDVDQDILALLNVSTTANADITYDDKYVYYTPSWGFNTGDRFQYCVTDFNDTACNFINVRVQNDPPVAKQDWYKINKNKVVYLDVMQNDYDPNQDNITIVSVGTASQGGAVISGNGATIRYTPLMSSQAYIDSFEYSITDGDLFAYSNVIVEVVNTPPTAGTINIVIHKNTNGTLIAIPYGDVDELDVLTVTVAQPPVLGTYTMLLQSYATLVPLNTDFYPKTVNNYTITYTPLYGPSGVYSETIKYLVSDGTDVATGIVNINVINDAPVAVTDYITCHKNLNVVYNVVANDYDPNQDSIKLVPNSAKISTDQGGYYVVLDDNNIQYFPKQGFLGNDTATYILTDIQTDATKQLTGVGQLVFNVINDPPTPLPDSYTVAKGLFKCLNVLANDTDPNGDAVSLNAPGTPSSKASAVASVENGVQCINYTALNQVYKESWLYTAQDIDGATAQALVTVNVVNTPPVAVDDFGTVSWNQSIIINVVANDFDENPGDKDILTVAPLSTATTAKGGSIQIVSGKAIRYTPPTGWIGTDTFQYYAFDSIDVSAQPATVTVTVVDRAPVANPSTVTLHWGTSLPINLLGIAGNNDPDSDPIVVSKISAATNGTVVLSNGIATYTALGYFVGNDLFTYTLSDWLLSATSNVSVIVTNTPPIANPVTIKVHWAAPPTTGYVSSVCSDPDNDPFYISGLNIPSGFKGTLVVTGDKYNVIYTPTNWKGTETAQYTITDGPATAQSTITVIVANANVPAPNDLRFVKHWSSQVQGTNIPILSAGQKDDDGDLLSFTTGTASNGAVTSNGLSINYKQTAGFLGNDQFTYTVSDGLDSALSNIYFTIFDNKPNASDYQVTKHWSLITSGIPLDTVALCNASDIDTAFGDVASLSTYSVNGASIGNTSRSANVLTFTPNTGVVGTQTYTVTFTDGLLTTTNSLAVTVQNVVPTAAPVAKTVHWSTQSTGTEWDLIRAGEITDADSDPLSYVSATNAVNGNVSITAGNKVLFKQSTNYLGTAGSFRVTFTDGWQQNSAVWQVIVVDAAPVAFDHTFTVRWTTYNGGSLLNVMSDAYDPDPQDTATLKLVGTPKNGTAVIENGNIRYTPNKPFVGVDTFTFTVTDGLLTVQKTVTVNVVDVAPVAVDDAVTMHWRLLTTTFPILNNDWDADNDTVSIRAITQQPSSPATITLVDANQGTVTFAVPSGTPFTTGLYTSKYTNTDGALDSSAANIVVNVVNPNTPSAPDVVQTYHWRTPNSGVDITIPGYTSTVDADNDPLTLSLVGSSAYAVKKDVAGSPSYFTYTHALWKGTDSFTYSLSDGMSSPQGKVTVNSYNNPPTANNVPNQFLPWTDFAAGQVIDVMSLGQVTDVDNVDVPFLTIVAVGKPGFTGSVTSIEPGSLLVRYKPASTFSGVDTFTYTVSDGLDNTTATVTVSATYNAPNPAAKYYRIHWSTYATGSNFSPLDGWGTAGQPNTITGVSSGPTTGNSVVVLPAFNVVNNTIKYTQARAYLGTDNVNLAVHDGVNPSSITTTIVVYDTAPVGQAKSVSTHWSTPITTDVVNGATDADNQDTVTLKSFGAATNGTTAASGARSVRYTGLNGFVGTDQYTFTVTDGLLNSQRTVTVTLTNTPPVPITKTWNIHWRDFTAGVTNNVLTGDTDGDNDPIKLVSVTQPNDATAGSVTVANINTGTVTVKGVASPVYYGKSYGFTYTETDGASNGQVSQTVTVNVKDQPPVANADSANIHWRTIGYSQNVLSNDNDPDTQDQGFLTLTGATSSVAGASVSVSGSNVVYTPKSKWTGVDVVTYSLFDGAMYASPAGKYTVTVFNQVPVAKNYAVTTAWSAIASSGITFSVISDATDPDTPDLPFLDLASPAPAVDASLGTVTTSGSLATAKVKFVPAVGVVGKVTFTYTITDGLATATGTISVTITDDPPTATPSNTNIHWRTQTTSGTTIPLTGTLSDPNNDPVFVQSVTSPTANGVASLSGFNILYKQNQNFLGSDSIQITFTDTWLPAVSATYGVVVYDNAPVAQPLTATMHSSQWSTGVTVSVTGNANTALRPTDADSQDAGFITVSGVSGTYSGTASVVSGTSILYKPVQNQLGTNVITYTVSDGLLTGSNTLTVTVYDNPPTNVNYNATVHWRTCINSGVTIQVSQFANDIDSQDFGKLTYTVSTNPSYAAVPTQPTTGTFLYKCNAGVGRVTDTFQFVTSDGTLSTTNTVTITVTNSAPVALDDFYIKHWKSSVFVADVLTNDTDPNSDPISVASGSLAANTNAGATLSVVAGGISYNLPSSSITPAKLNAADVFNYVITDTVDQSAPAKVSVRIVDAAPTASPYSKTISWNQQDSTVLGTNCIDSDIADTPVFGSITNPLAGTVTVTNQATGAITYVPASAAPQTTSYSVTYYMTYICTDGLLTGSNTVAYTVTNNAPTLAGKSATVQRNYNNPTNTFTGLLSGIDADGDSLTASNVQLSSSSASGTTVAWTATSDSFTVTVPATFRGTKTLTWSVYDGQLYSPAATYTINYLNTPPVCQNYAQTTNKNTNIVFNQIAAGCSDANNDPLTYNVLTTVPFGTLTSTSGPVVTYTPAAKKSGTFAVTYTTTDVVGDSTTNTLTITVNNRAPTAYAQTYTFAGSYANNTAYSISTYLADSKSSDPDTGDSLSIVSAYGGTCNNPDIGSTTVVNGVIQFTRKYSYWFGDSCTFTVKITDDDNNPLTATATVTIVMNAPAPPVANDDYYSVNQNAGLLQIPINAVTYTSPSTGASYNGMMMNDVAPAGANIVFDSLLPCASGYCHTTPTVSSDGNFINYQVDNRNCVQDKFQYKIRTATPTPLYATATVYISFVNCYCSSALDVFFVIDSSASIGATNFKTQRSFLVNLTKNFDISAGKVNVGVAQFADDGFVYQSLTSSASSVTNVLTTLPYLNGGTHTLSGIYSAMADITGTFPNNGTTRTAMGRANVPKVLVIVTDGCANTPCSCTSNSYGMMTCAKFYASSASIPTQCNSVNYPGLDCRNCDYGNFYKQYQTQGAQAQTGCMPCADPIQYTDKINSWNVDSTGASTSPFSNFPVWKVVALGVGDLVNNTFGRSQISGMNYNHNQLLLVSWSALSSAVSAIVDAACNTA